MKNAENSVAELNFFGVCTFIIGNYRSCLVYAKRRTVALAPAGWVLTLKSSKTAEANKKTKQKQQQNSNSDSNKKKQ